MENNFEEVVEECRICKHTTTGELLIKPWLCSGTIGFVHLSCLSQWMQSNKEEKCRICSSKFDVQYVKMGHNLFKYLEDEHNGIDLIGTILANALALLFTFAFIEVYRTEWFHQLFYFWIFVVSLLTIDLCLLGLGVQSWLTLNKNFRYWQKRNFDIVITYHKN